MEVVLNLASRSARPERAHLIAADPARTVLDQLHRRAEPVAQGSSQLVSRRKGVELPASETDDQVGTTRQQVTQAIVDVSEEVTEIARPSRLSSCST
ncbi:MAG: hypothetical protein D6696_00420 [Acidobacteria bacterium]|nr:MAG: hypothetical protein D6696_00420 [Acidobacteriota bacterium]